MNKEMRKDQLDQRDLFLKSLGLPAFVLKPQRMEKDEQIRALLYHSKVIFNPPATILIVGDKKVISKVYSEEFDEEKGLLMCIAKYFDISYQDIKRLLGKAKHQNN